MLTQGADHEIREVPMPEPGPGEVRIRVAVAGICGTDLHIMNGDFPAGRVRPLILGHEFAGTIDKVGQGVTEFTVGDRVAADPNLSCGTCPWCAREAYNLCEEWGALGITVDGALAEYVCVPAALAVGLPPDMSFSAGALIEPLSCALHAFDYADVLASSPGYSPRTLVYGAGMMGLACVALAVERGHEVAVVESHAPRREFAQRLGAATSVAGGADLPEGGFDYVIEATGNPAAITDAYGRLDTRGTLLQLGVAPPDFHTPVNPHDVYQRELRIVGSFSVADQYVNAARRIRELPEGFEEVVTHKFPLERFDAALAAMATPEVIKVHIDVTT